jgi:hypothetical protein
MADIEYRNYRIYQYDPPGPWYGDCWAFVHKDYDGEGDRRCGYCHTVDQCKIEIDDLEGDEGEGEMSAVEFVMFGGRK